ncbi:MAG: class III poly(R)-hydroxyalkanoic acid synthase subunit PhaC [Thermoplasmata archaeon]
MEKDYLYEEMIQGMLNIQSDFIKEIQEDIESWNKAVPVLQNSPEVKVGQTPADVIFKDDFVELLHYKNPGTEEERPPLLMVYALINQPYILDLQSGRSVVESLLKSGIDVYMINWGNPDDRHQFLTLDDYVNYFIDVCVDKVRKDSDRDAVHILGYCMGGTMSVMYTGLHPEKVKTLTLMAAGIDFSDDEGMLSFWANKEYFDAEKVAEAFGTCPGKFLDGAYQWLDPIGNMYSKFQNFSRNVDNEKFVKMFFRMEKWIHDDKDIPGPTFAKFVKELYQENKLVNNKFRLGGKLVDLKNITLPVLTLVGDYDTLVPPKTSLSFNHKVSSEDTMVMRAPVGHIGLSVSSKTHKGMWNDVAEWIKERDLPAPIEDVKGIGKNYGAKLRDAGIETPDDLLESDTDDISNNTGISRKRIDQWKKNAEEC